ncbi:hypothetical protein Avbf_03458 [Armadillidium vulgare]|nr:hypothetical protein Avbf_03458 [Armadillidium vulgare]
MISGARVKVCAEYEIKFSENQNMLIFEILFYHSIPYIEINPKKRLLNLVSESLRLVFLCTVYGSEFFAPLDEVLYNHRIELQD